MSINHILIVLNTTMVLKKKKKLYFMLYFVALLAVRFKNPVVFQITSFLLRRARHVTSNVLLLSLHRAPT